MIRSRRDMCTIFGYMCVGMREQDTKPKRTRDDIGTNMRCVGNINRGDARERRLTIVLTT